MQSYAAAAATLATPAVRQAAMPWRRYSTGVGPWSWPTRTAGWSESTTVTDLCSISWVAP